MSIFFKAFSISLQREQYIVGDDPRKNDSGVSRQNREVMGVFALWSYSPCIYIYEQPQL